MNDTEEDRSLCSVDFSDVPLYPFSLDNQSSTGRIQMKLSKTDFLDVHQAFLELHNLYYLCNALRQNKLKIVFKWFILSSSLNIDSLVQLHE